MNSHQIAILTLFLAFSATALADMPDELWSYDGAFHRAIASADRLVVLPRSREYSEKYPVGEPLFVVIDQDELHEVAQRIAFVSPQVVKHYFFPNSPALEWYRGEERMAVGGLALDCFRGSNLPGDVKLTDASATWLTEWLAKHGEDLPGRLLKKHWRREAVAAEAQPILDKFTPPGLIDAMERAEEESWNVEFPDADVQWIDRYDGLMARYIRGAFIDTDSMYRSLFRLVGCLPMSWGMAYDPGQYEVLEFLRHVSTQELDDAFAAALGSEEIAWRRGAARVAFFQEPYEEKAEEVVSRWMADFAEIAYSSPIAKNRRFVLECLVEDPTIAADQVLSKAVCDPDQTIRRRAMKAISLRGDERGLALLRRIAAGELKPRAASAMAAKDYANCARRGWQMSNDDAETLEDTDQEAATYLIEVYEWNATRQ